MQKDIQNSINMKSIILGIIMTFLLMTSCCFSTKPQKEDLESLYSPEIQAIFDSLLIERMLELNTKSASGAILDVKTGNIVAMSNWEQDNDSVQKSYNHMLLDMVDPGSAFQIVSYAALLESGKISPDSLFDTGNTEDNPTSFEYYGQVVRDDHPVGIVTADEVIVQSSNIAIVKMVAGAFESSPQEYLDAIASLGWYETPLWVYEGDTLAEARVREYGDAAWSKVSLGQISYGYEMRATPMHTLLFMNSIANDGIRPGFGRICSENTVKQVKKSLEGVVERGTACTIWSSEGMLLREGAKSQTVNVAGKTGEARIFADGSYFGNGHYVTFVGYFPAENPKYSCLVTLEAVPGGNFGRPGGGYMAGAVVRKLAESICQNM